MSGNSDMLKAEQEKAEQEKAERDLETGPSFLANGPLRPLEHTRERVYRRLLDAVRGSLAPAPGDATRALLDAAATLADNVAFYQERIAHEGYLPTATEERSVRELVSSIGYAPVPGVAASVWLAFTLEDGPDAPHEVTIPAGFKIQSTPRAGEKAQTFETSRTVTLRTGGNALPLALEDRPDEAELEEDPDLTEAEQEEEASPVADDSTFPEILEDSNDDAVGDGFESGDESGINAKDLSDKPMEGEAPDPTEDGYDPSMDLGVQAGESGENAGRSKDLKAAAIEEAGGESDTSDTSEEGFEPEAGKDNTDYKPPKNTRLVARFSPGTRGIITLREGTPPLKQGDRLLWLKSRKTRLRIMLVMSCKTLKGGRGLKVKLVVERTGPRLSSLKPGYYLLTERVGFFGHNASRWRRQDNADVDPRPPTFWNYDRRGVRSIFQDQDGLFFCRQDGPHVHLERPVDDLGKGRLLLLEDGRRIRAVRVARVAHGSLAEYGMSGKVTSLWLKVECTAVRTLTRKLKRGTDVIKKLDIKWYSLGLPRFDRRKTTASVVALETLPLARRTLKRRAQRDVGVDDLKATDEILLEGPAPEVVPGDPLLISGVDPQTGRPVQELVVVAGTSVDDQGITTLRLAERLTGTYRGQTVTVRANLVRATHGETVEELLGSGDSNTFHQQFKLRRPPLTWLADGSARGMSPALEVRVNGVRWHEVPSLLDQAPGARCFTVRIDEDGAACISFGDGVHGARLPSGRDNVRARYRVGAGRAGALNAGQLTVMPSRSAGLKSVTNPFPTEGADEPEGWESARSAAPHQVVTLQRVVSLRDYEAFAAGYRGIGCARATPLEHDGAPIVFVSVFGERGEALSQTLDLLRQALDAARSPLVKLELKEGDLLRFGVKAQLTIHPDWEPGPTIAATRAALLEAFSFERRQPGQSVTTLELNHVLHGVSGVIAANILALYLTGDGESSGLTGEGASSPPAELTARLARLVRNVPSPAELLVVDPAHVQLDPTPAASEVQP